MGPPGEPEVSQPPEQPGMNKLRILVVWLWVLIPLGWGVMKSVQKALPLFTQTTAVKAK